MGIPIPIWGPHFECRSNLGISSVGPQIGMNPICRRHHGRRRRGNDDDAVDAVVLPSSTKDKNRYIGELMAFESTCVGPFADGAGESTATSALLPPRCHHRAVRHRRCLGLHNTFNWQCEGETPPLLLFALFLICGRSVLVA